MSIIDRCCRYWIVVVAILGSSEHRYHNQQYHYEP